MAMEDRALFSQATIYGTQMNHQPNRPRKNTFFGFPKLPARCAVWVMPLLLSIFMTFVVSMISTLRGVGLSPEMLKIWMSAWALSWIFAFPILLLVLPVVRKATAAIVDMA
jgi:hypothetical protein